ncbi:MAG: FHA domain-containing protein [Pyrobaculum sp.]
MPWRCPICGTENRDEVTTCRVCGAYKPEATTKKVGIPEVATVVIEVVESSIQSLVGKRFELKASSPGLVITVGRAVDNNVIIPDPAVSRRHLRLVVTSGGIVVEDLGSSNGTYLITDGERLVKVENVGRQAYLRIGSTKIRVSI